MKSTIHNTGAIILSAGLSKRMKMHKALLRWNNEKSFLSHIVETYINSGIKQIVIVANPQLFSQLKCKPFVKNKKVSILENQNTEKGRNYSVKLGLSKLNDPMYAFIQNVDNPFITDSLIQQMMAIIQPDCYVNPVFKGQKGHPVLLSHPIIMDILGDKPIMPTLKDYLINYTPIALERGNNATLRNINTMNDYNKYF